MKLIDADALKAKYPDRISLNRTLDEATTAFNMDKVIEKLKDLAKDLEEEKYHEHCKRYAHMCRKRGCFECILDEAIEIVKAGGVNE